MADSCAFVDIDTDTHQLESVGVFLSHSSQDRQAVIRINDQLRIRGVASTWVDHERLTSGMQWWPEIEDAIRSRSHLVVLVSPAALESSYVLKEVEFATRNNKLVVPVMLSQVNHADLPDIINRWQFLPRYYSSETDDEFYLELARKLPRPRRYLLPRMIEIPEGQFKMGPSARLAHTSRYWMGKNSVTYAEFACFITSGGYQENGNWPRDGELTTKTLVAPRTAAWFRDVEDGSMKHPMQPFRGASWYEAAAYCQWLSHFSDWDFSLPTEEQWEKAARGTDGRKWPFGNTWDLRLPNPSADVDAPSDCCIEGSESPYGCQDMAGHVWNWTMTVDLGPDALPVMPSHDFREPRVIRGGSWKQNRYKSYTCHRESQFPNAEDYPDQIGFRLVTETAPTWRS